MSPQGPSLSGPFPLADDGILSRAQERGLELLTYRQAPPRNPPSGNPTHSHSFLQSIGKKVVRLTLVIILLSHGTSTPQPHRLLDHGEAPNINSLLTLVTFADTAPSART
jgi:hypothetical protein